MKGKLDSGEPEPEEGREGKEESVGEPTIAIPEGGTSLGEGVGKQDLGGEEEMMEGGSPVAQREGECPERGPEGGRGEDESVRGNNPERGRRDTLLSHGFTKSTVSKVQDPDVPTLGTKRARKRKLKCSQSEMASPKFREGSDMRKFVIVKRRLIPAEK